MVEFVKVCSVTDVKTNSVKRFSVSGKEIALFNLNGKFFAIAAHCTHAEGPLDEGSVEGNEVECPWHGARFDITTGKATSPPASNDIQKYEVKLEGSDVMIKL